MQKTFKDSPAAQILVSGLQSDGE